MALSTAPPHTTDASARRRLGTGLMAAVAAYVVAIATMGLVFASAPPPRLVEGLAAFQEGELQYRLGFVGASLLAPAFVAILVLLVTAAGVPVSSARRSVATVLLGAYVALVTFAYTSQYTFLPNLVARDPEAAALWYFHDVDSIPYAIDLAGYALLGLASLLLASALAEQGRKWLAGWLAAMGALSVVAFGLHGAGVGTFAGIVSLTSAALTLPVVALALLEGRRLRARP